LYLHPGTNGNDKRVLRPLKLILKVRVMKKAAFKHAFYENNVFLTGRRAQIRNNTPTRRRRRPSTSGAWRNSTTCAGILLLPRLKGLKTAPKKPPKLHARKKRRRPAKRLSAGGGARPRKKRRVSAVSGEGTLEELLCQLTKTGQEENARAAETAVAEKKKNGPS
jgi:hypothetical protein